MTKHNDYADVPTLSAQLLEMEARLTKGQDTISEKLDALRPMLQGITNALKGVDGKALAEVLRWLGEPPTIQPHEFDPYRHLDRFDTSRPEALGKTP